MLSRRDRFQDELFVAGSLRDLIPDEHVLVRVDRVLDLSWLRDAVVDCYDLEQGRPGIDPEVAVRLMLAGLLCGIVHDRHLLREAQVNLAIRWFIGYRLHERLPHHSSLTRIRQRWGAERFQSVFQRGVQSCVEAGLVAGDTVHVDASLIRADVSWDSLAVDHAAAVGAANQDSDAEGGGDDDADDAPPAGGGRRRGRPRKAKKAKKRSATDADARMATSRRDHYLEPSYKQLTAVDSARGVVVDAEVVLAEVHEGGTLLAQLGRVEELIGRPTKQVTADKGYAYSANYKALEDRRTEAVIPPQRVRKARMPLSRFKYDGKHDVVRCPAGKTLRAATRVGSDGRFYRARRIDCAKCRFAAICLPKTAKARSVIIKDGHGALLRARRRHGRRLPADKLAQNRHRVLVEGIHGEAKARHGLNRARRRGLWNVQIQAWLTAAAINLKRLAKAWLRQMIGRISQYCPIAGLYDRLRYLKAEIGTIQHNALRTA